MRGAVARNDGVEGVVTPVLEDADQCLEVRDALAEVLGAHGRPQQLQVAQRAGRAISAQTGEGSQGAAEEIATFHVRSYFWTAYCGEVRINTSAS